MKFPFALIAVIAAVLLVAGCQTTNQETANEAPVEMEQAEAVPTQVPPTAVPATDVPEPSTPVVTGALTTDGAVALPADSMISVQLYGVSADGVAIVSDQSIASQGQLPAAFAVAYNADDIDPNTLYTLHADVKDASGTMLFVSTGLFPVITFGNPTTGVNVTVFPIATVPPGEEPAPGTPPVVTATLNPYEAAAGDTVDVYTHATATDGAGVVKLELYIDDNMTNEWTSDTPEGVPYTHQTFTLRDVEVGEYVIRVKAIDSQGDEGWSADEKLTVK